MRKNLSLGDSRSENDRLLSYMAAGDEEAFHRLYKNTVKAVHGYILSYVENPQDAEEVMQETYLKTWTPAGSHASQGEPMAWLFTIARNLCLTRFRQQRYQADMSIYELEGQEPGEVCREIEMAPEKMTLLSALPLLKEEDRQIVLLHEAGGLKHRETVKNLEMPLATVSSKYNRVIKKMIGYMKQEQAGGR